MAFPILFYFLGALLVGGVVGISLASFYDGIKSWVKNSFNYLVTEIRVVVDKFWVGGKRTLRIRATTQKNQTIETQEDVKIENLPPEIRLKIDNNSRYEDKMILSN